MKRFLRKKLFKSASSSAKHSISSLNSIGDDVYCGYHIDLCAVDSSFTKLHKGCFLGDGDKVKAALKKVDVNARDSEGRTPLHIAAASGHRGVVQLLLQAKSQLDTQDREGKTPLIKAVECQHEVLARMLLDEGASPNLADNNGDTALHVALSSRHPDIAALLLQYSVDISVQNKEGMSALHLAVLQKHLEVVGLLLDKGADPRVQDEEGRTPLMLACRIGCASLTSLLLKNGADPMQTDMAGWTALVHATKAGHTECQQVFIAFSGQISQAILSPAEDLDSWKSTESEQSEKPKKSLLPLACKAGNATSSPATSSIASKELCKSPHLPPLNDSAINKPEESLLIKEYTREQQDTDTTAAAPENRENRAGSSPSEGTDSDSVEAVFRKASVQHSSLVPAFEKPIHHNPTDDKSKNLPQNGKGQSTNNPGEVEPQNDGDDISKWFTEDTSLTESEIEEKASSLYIPSALERRPSIFDPNVHKSVEVLLAYDGQQLKDGSMLPVQRERRSEQENISAVSQKVEVKQNVSMSASEWDSSEGGEELPYVQHSVQAKQNGTSGQIDTIQGAKETGEEEQNLEGHERTAVSENVTSGTILQKGPLAVVTDASVQQPSRSSQDMPKRPPRSPSKNGLRSSWSSSTSSSPSKSRSLEHCSPRRQSLIVRNNEGPVGPTTKHYNEGARMNLAKELVSTNSSKSSKSSSRKAAIVQESTKRSPHSVPNVDGEASASKELPASEAPVQHQTTPIAYTAHIPAGGVQSEGLLIESLLNEKKLLSRQLLESDELRRTLEARIMELQMEVHDSREAEVKETIDKQLADLDLELKSAKSLIKDLQHEIESLQRQLNSYKESADMYREVSEKQEEMFKNMLAEKEKLWAEEKQRLITELQVSNSRTSEAISPSKLDDIQEQLTSLHGVLASLNAKVITDAKESSLPLPEEITSLIQISRSSLSDLQNLNTNVNQTAQLLQSISENLQNSNDQGKAIGSSLDDLQEAIGNSSRSLLSVSDTLHTLASDRSNICETLERLEANQKLLTNTLNEFQSLINKSGLDFSLGKDNVSEAKEFIGNHGTHGSTPNPDDLTDLKESIARVLNKLDCFAEEIKNVSESKAEDVARKVADSFEEYHNITKQEMLNLMNKVSCNQEAVVKASFTLSEHQKAHDAKLSEEFDYLKLNQSKALEQLQSLKDELIRMDSSGMFDKLESMQIGTVGKISSIIEPVSTELKSIRASLDNNNSVWASRISQPSEAGGAAQLRNIMDRLDSVLDQTNKLQTKEERDQSKNITLDIKGAFPYADFSVLLSDLRMTLHDLKGEIQKHHGSEKKESREEPQVRLVPECTSSVHKCNTIATNGMQTEGSFEKEKYRNKKALVKYKAELKAIKEKLKDIGQRQDRGSIYDNVPPSKAAVELQTKVDLLNLRIDSDHRHQTYAEIRSLKAEVHQIQHSLPGLMQEQSFKPVNTDPANGQKGPQPNVNDSFIAERTELMEIKRLQENLMAAQSDTEYWWLKENHHERNPIANGIKSAQPHPAPRKKQVTRAQSTPQPSTVPYIMRKLPAWNMSPVTAKASPDYKRPHKPTNGARYRVQAMLEESLSRHLGKASRDGVQGACTSTDTQFNTLPADRTKTIHKTDIV
ncbi:ankycorbin-like isoform X2 [Ornithodoros turicata]|uniref:ankycorbin-like isoform X2 n=1 Tax=Ornithodoros turicata TaxID=34597 RepID=UPI003138AA01